MTLTELIERVRCLFRGHDWSIIDHVHTDEQDIDIPVLWEPPHDYYTLACKRCGHSDEHEVCEWFNQYGVDVDALAHQEGE